MATRRTSYTEAEAQAILDQAILAEFEPDRDALVSQQELRELAMAAGISESALARGEARWRVGAYQEEWRQHEGAQQRSRQRLFLYGHLLIYLMLLPLMLLALFGSQKDAPLILMTIAGWALGMGAHVASRRRADRADSEASAVARQQWLMAHAALFVTLNMLIVVATTAMDGIWALWSLCFWGSGLLIHALSVRGTRPRRFIAPPPVEQP